MRNGEDLLSVEELQEEWHEQNGWAATPPADVVSYWHQVAAEASGVAREVDAPSTAPVEPPAVIGAELPDSLIMPAHPRVDGSAGFDIELSDVGGAPVLVAYSAVSELVKQLGEDQPWVVLPVSAVRKVHSGLPIVLDPTPGIISGRWTRSRLTALQEALSDG